MNESTGASGTAVVRPATIALTNRLRFQKRLAEYRRVGAWGITFPGKLTRKQKREKGLKPPTQSKFSAKRQRQKAEGDDEARET